MINLKDLPEISENKLRDLEKRCINPDGTINYTIVSSYYAAARRLEYFGYDSRHHIAIAFSYYKTLKNDNSRLHNS
jgi:hypothetical protein